MVRWGWKMWNILKFRYGNAFVDAAVGISRSLEFHAYQQLYLKCNSILKMKMHEWIIEQGSLFSVHNQVTHSLSQTVEISHKLLTVMDHVWNNCFKNGLLSHNQQANKEHIFCQNNFIANGNMWLSFKCLRRMEGVGLKVKITAFVTYFIMPWQQFQWHSHSESAGQSWCVFIWYIFSPNQQMQSNFKLHSYLTS